MSNGGSAPRLLWIDATKRHPDQRPVGIAEMVRLLQHGYKQRPRSVLDDSSLGG